MKKQHFAKWSVLTLTLALAASFTFLTSTATAFSLFGDVCKDKTKAAASPTCQQVASQSGNPIVHTINVAADIIAMITGIAAVIVIIIGGLTMITSSGNTEAVAASRRRIIYAIVGLVIVALAWTITRFITDTFIK